MDSRQPYCQSIESTLRAIWQFCRWRPVFAWSISGVLISIALAYHDSYTASFSLIMALLIVPVLLQIASHVHNDISDLRIDEVDIDNITKTGRSKPIATGLMTEKSANLYLLFLILLSCIILFLFIPKIAIIPLLLGVTSIFLYNFFLKNKPFTEITLVLPLIIIITVTPYIVITSTCTTELIVLALCHAMLNATWFISSREQDKNNDARFGKNTTSVWCSKHDIRSETIQSAYMSIIAFICAISIFKYTETIFFLCTLVLFIATSEKEPHEQRRICIYLTTINAMLISMYLLVF